MCVALGSRVRRAGCWKAGWIYVLWLLLLVGSETVAVLIDAYLPQLKKERLGRNAAARSFSNFAADKLLAGRAWPGGVGQLSNDLSEDVFRHDKTHNPRGRQAERTS